jgi:hypothetical protein
MRGFFFIGLACLLVCIWIGSFLLYHVAPPKFLCVL